MAREAQVGLEARVLLVLEERRDQGRIEVAAFDGSPQDAFDRRKDLGIAILCRAATRQRALATLAAQIVLDLVHQPFDADG
jgi:hypothetical protein